MNPASPAQYLVREQLVDVGLGRVPAAGVSRSTQINQPLL